MRDLDVDTLTVADAVELVDWFAEIERLASAGKAIAASRVEATGAWRASGERSAADWLARRTGSTVGDARGALWTGARVAKAPATNDALRNGELSAQQAEAIAAAAVADPSAESRLLEMAKYQSLQKLRDETARVRAAAEPDPAARHARIHRDRFWKKWTDPEGARCGAYRLTPEAAAMLEANAQPFIDASIDAARRLGEFESSEAYAADGLVAMSAYARQARESSDSDTSADDGHRSGDHGGGGGGGDSGGPSSGSGSGGVANGGGAGADCDDDRSGTERRRKPRGGRGRKRLRNRRELFALVDLAAWRRGWTECGETCEIPGVGPVPVEVARREFGDALLRIVIRDGVDIRTVVHAGRVANAVQETAVLVRDGGRCIRPTCDLPAAEIDHITGYTKNHITTLDDLGGLCLFDHHLKTHAGHTYRRLPDGTIEWRRPDGGIERERPPP